MANVRSCARILAGCLIAGGAAGAPDGGAEPKHQLAFGVRFGFLPPVFTVAELLARPVPHLAL
ncbi:MAG TPA: hypothetical protein VFP52_09950, partial [Myxococcales bacterium]|nr:hypothetical protein [Myxococcales bacterium]